MYMLLRVCEVIVDFCPTMDGNQVYLLLLLINFYVGMVIYGACAVLLSNKLFWMLVSVITYEETTMCRYVVKLLDRMVWPLIPTMFKFD